MLARTPTPHSTESLIGYVLRISESNGYDTPSYLLNYIAETTAECQSRILSIDKLAALIGKPSSTLLHLANKKKTPNGKYTYCILGHSLTESLSFNPLRLKQPAFCPRCVKEHGFIDAFWDLKLAVACPFHQCELITACPACHSLLSWYRPGLLKCKCGASLSDYSTPTASPEVIDLMRILQAKLHGTDPGLLSAGLPAKEINSMRLRSILLKLPHLARFTEGGSSNSPIAIVAQTARILADWPNGFHTLLSKMAANQNTSGTAFRKRYEDFYELIFKGSSADDVRWLRHEFILYGLEKAQDSVMDWKILRGESTKRRFVTKKELAHQLGVTQSTLTRWCDDGKLNLKTLQNQKQKRYIADTASIDIAPPLQGKGVVLNYREGAAYIGMPITILAKLKANGHIPSQYRIRYKGGYHQDDLDTFKKALLALSPSRAIVSDQNDISLSQVLSHYRFHSTDRKADFVLAYLDGRVISTGRTEDSLGGIQFKRSDVFAFVEQCRNEAAKNSLSMQKAAAMLNCDIDAIHGLLSMGHLTEGHFSEGMRTTLDSCISFSAQYTPLGQIAYQWNTNASRLIRLAHKASLDLLTVNRRGKSSKAYFISNKDTANLKKWHEQSPKRTTSAAPPPIRRTTAALSNYLESLKLAGAPLPMHNDAPNLKAIAQACGFDRNVLYRNKAVQSMLRAFTA